MIDLAASAGLILDEAQQLALDDGLGHHADGQWATPEVGVIEPRQNGKGPHDLRTPVLTTEGWTTIGEICPGQYVYGADGSPVRVVACSKVFPALDCYQVTFTDGSRHIVAGEHLWHVKDKSSGRWAALSTEHLASRHGERRADNGRMEYRYRVRCDARPDTPYVDLPIDPYLFGYWLGDGTARASCITVGAQDKEWVVDRLSLAGARVVRIVQHNHGHAWGVFFRLDAKVRDGFESRCRRLGVWGRKHIPEVYLTASIEQRAALLAGMMDSDGSIAITNRSPQVEFSTSYPDLVAGFHRLARSLGVRVTPIRRVTSRLDNWRFLWTPTFDPFEMPRKSERFKPPASSRQSLMSITSIEHVESVPTRCIQVDRSDGVYLVGHHFTPTHNSILEARTLGGLYLFAEPLILWTSHEFKTSREGFLRIRDLIDGADHLRRRVRQVRVGAGEEGIEMLSGARLRFIARSRGSGRGFSAPCVLLDEAYALTDDQMAALLPTLSAYPNSQTWYTSSAPLPESTVLRRLCSRGRRGSLGLAYLEWCAADDAVLDDPEAWRQANPALGVRIGEDAIRRELGAMSVEDFRRERLGIWREDLNAAWQAIPEPAWSAAKARFTLDDPVALGVDVTPDRTWSAIVAAGRVAAGGRGVDLVEHRPGTGWVIGRLRELVDNHSPCVVVTSDRALADAAEEAKLTVYRAGAGDMASSANSLYDGIAGTAADVRHLGQAELTSAVAGATKRTVGDGWAWDRRSVQVDICPLVAASLALWAAGTPRIHTASFAPFALT